jgi:Domain of unknown function (DUF4389)
MPSSDYPVKFFVEYPDRGLNRLTTGFRIFTAVPIVIVTLALGGSWAHYAHWVERWIPVPLGGAGTVFLATVLMLLFRKKYPRWWFDWNLELMRFSNRVGVYLLLMDDRYPSTDERQSVYLDFPYPDVERDLERGMPLVKWLLAIPHLVVLAVLSIGVCFAAIGAWLAILFTGHYPRTIFHFVEGFMRWWNRVWGYAFVLATDRYPPFRFSA